MADKTSEADTPKIPGLLAASKLTTGMILRGFVRHIGNDGLRISFASNSINIGTDFLHASFKESVGFNLVLIREFDFVVTGVDLGRSRVRLSPYKIVVGQSLSFPMAVKSFSAYNISPYLNLGIADFDDVQVIAIDPEVARRFRDVTSWEDATDFDDVVMLEPYPHQVLDLGTSPITIQPIPSAPPQHLTLSIEVGEYTDEDEAVEAIVNLYRAMNEYHIASGGNGLTIDDWKVMCESGVPTEVE